MQYRIVPKNGDALSALGFGAMRLPQKRGEIDQDRAISQIRYAIDHGVNYLDTAFPYHRGKSEDLLGKALRGGYREKVKVATKLPAFAVNKLEDMETILISQLKKLQTDHIDYYLLHGLKSESWNKLRDLNVLGFLQNAKMQGKILNTGFSFHGSQAAFKEIVDAYDWTMCQIQYNFLDENLQAGTLGLKYAASKGLAVMVMEPLRGGLLAGKLPTKVQEVYANAQMKRSAAEWALRWVWNHPEITVVLSGMNSQKQIEENIATAETAVPNSMTQQELETIGQVAESYRQLMKVPCTGCSYCMPCPNGVDIPTNFDLLNQYSMFGHGVYSKLYTRGMYAVLLMGIIQKASDAAQCTNCGVCTKKCPQQIAIPEKLRDVKNWLGGYQTKIFMPVFKVMNPLKPRKSKKNN